ncbi:MAG: formate-dependent nitrite reductase membrane component [Bacteroidetes bacterium]|nr:MAG: formate-dependent nitrite reductase membrane component [Bacteroidota bacterium]
MNLYRRINNITGWVVFIIASSVYLLTAEPTTSFWDCGEYIATAFKLQVGHPPGAPLFQMLGRFFSLFAFGNEANVAFMINAMSAFSSGFTILFLFWSISHLTKKLVSAGDDLQMGEILTITGSALVGALAYTFSDSFWFSAVEGEVYAMSSFFTAFVFWAMLKWEDAADQPHSIRWIVLIAFMIGLSIGVHLLNLLAIPAITLIFYFKKYKPSAKGIVLALISSVLLIGLIMNLIVPWIVKLAGLFELFFVNSVGLPFNIGTVIYFLLIGSGIVWGLYYTRKTKKVLWNTILLSFTFILIGYSSFFMLIIRSNANTPINENQPSNAISLLSYLNREQYGDWPLLHGPYYNAPVVDRTDGNPVYKRDDASGKYVIIDNKKDMEPVYDPAYTTIFPRMWSGNEQTHKDNYKKWGKVKGTPLNVTNQEGEPETLIKPTFSENLRFFWNYQLQFMYVRYFMWNFAGKQNDVQGFGNDLDGNWISGINWLDEMRLGPQKNIPESMENKGRNKFYLLPLLLGLAGLVWHTNRNHKDALVVAMMFIMTGLAIVVYLNQYAYQPRERDYAYAASFYAFAIWIGIGVAALIQLMQKILKRNMAALLATGICLVAVPGIMASQGWDDHDRSDRYTGREIARSYLESCAPNAILFTMGDNDTFPLWYAQDVEGIRTDVRVVNLSLLSADWYIGQMKRKVYDSEPVPFSLTYDEFKSGTREVVYISNDQRLTGPVDLKELFNIIHTQPEALQVNSSIGMVDYFPTNYFYLNVDSAMVVNNGTVPPDDAKYIVDTLTWKINRSMVTKSSLMVLDLLANNNWQRPVYFSTTAGESAYLGLTEYFRLEGMAYRLVPVKKPSGENFMGHINSGILYDRLMNKFNYGNMEKPGVYLDETNRRMVTNLRNNFGKLAEQLLAEGKNKEAIAVCERCLAFAPDNAMRYDFFLLPVAEVFLKAGAEKQGMALLGRLYDLYTEDLDYYFSFPKNRIDQFDNEMQQALAMINRVGIVAGEHNNEAFADKARAELEKQYEKYVMLTGKR